MSVDLRHALSQADGGPVEEVDAHRVVRQGRRRRRRRRGAHIAAVIVVVVAGALIAPRVDVDLMPASPSGHREVREVGTWGELPPAPIPHRTGAASLLVDDRLIVVGGLAASPAGIVGDALGDGAIYDVAAEEWSRLDDLPGGVAGSVTLLQIGAHVAAVGADAAQRLVVTWLDGAAWSEPVVLLAEPGVAGLVHDDRRIVAIGIVDNPLNQPALSPESPIRSLEVGADVPETLPGAPLSLRSGSVVELVGDHLVVWGGRGQTGGRLDVEPRGDGAVLDLTNGQWADLPEPDAGGSDGALSAVVGREVVVMGGLGRIDEATVTAESRALSDTTMVLDVDGGTWREVRTPRSIRSAVAVVVAMADGPVRVHGGRVWRVDVTAREWVPVARDPFEGLVLPPTEMGDPLRQLTAGPRGAIALLASRLTTDAVNDELLAGVVIDGVTLRSPAQRAPTVGGPVLALGDGYLIRWSGAFVPTTLHTGAPWNEPVPPPVPTTDVGGYLWRWQDSSSAPSRS